MKKYAKLIIIVGIFFIAISDLLLLYYGGSEATYSKILLNGAKEYPALPFAFGFVAGHVFWPND